MINELNRHLLDKPSFTSDRCCVCQAPATNRHHVIQKGMGGSKLARRIPTLPLCGNGNADGCHGLAHSGRLFFDWQGPGSGAWYYCIMDEPTTLQDALDNGEWLPCYG